MHPIPFMHWITEGWVVLCPLISVSLKIWLLLPIPSIVLVRASHELLDGFHFINIRVFLFILGFILFYVKVAWRGEKYILAYSGLH